VPYLGNLFALLEPVAAAVAFIVSVVEQYKQVVPAAAGGLAPANIFVSSRSTCELDLHVVV
jgi:hypothetical protein